MRSTVVVVVMVALVACRGGGAEEAACRSSRGVADFFGYDGSFETPEEALADVLDGLDTAPGEYERVRVEEDRREFHYIGRDFSDHYWDLWREPEGWYVQSVSGCLDLVQ